MTNSFLIENLTRDLLESNDKCNSRLPTYEYTTVPHDISISRIYSYGEKIESRKMGEQVWEIGRHDLLAGHSAHPEITGKFRRRMRRWNSKRFRQPAEYNFGDLRTRLITYFFALAIRQNYAYSPNFRRIISIFDPIDRFCLRHSSRSTNPRLI